MTAPTATDIAGVERHRGRLFGLAYRMLADVHDAEDVVQDTFLRWVRAPRDDVRSVEAWLVATATRLCIDRVRHAAVERRAYPGPWLPEPFAGDELPASDEPAELRSEISMAFLVLLQRLGPVERAAFLLRDVFQAGYDEIALTLGRSEAAVRQVVHRARDRVRTARARFDVPDTEREALLRRLLAALEAGDRESLLRLVSDDATFTADGGGRVSAVRRVVAGGDRVVRLLLGLEAKYSGITRHRIARINGEPAVLTYVAEQLLATTSFALDGGRIVAGYRVMNPAKLTHVISAPAS